MIKHVFDKRRLQSLISICQLMGIEFTDYELLHRALTHTSYANESKNNASHNERLEFLGDAVLDLIVSEILYCRFADLPEGELTKARARLVCEQTLVKYAQNLRLGEYLLLGKGEALSGGRTRQSILADAFEAVIGALYLDKGLKATSEFVLKIFAEELLYVERGEYVKDYKTLLQETIQRTTDKKISYEVTDESGPDHNKTFEVAVYVNGERLGMGKGKSKKEAEQNSAHQALVALKVIRVN